MPSGELKPIILYDIPCTTPGRPWSPNTLKTRYCLGYKQLPFTTIWVEMPDIAGLLQSKGITHPPYTLPAIEDPNTGAFIMDSFTIAAYLDETYPETPKVLAPAARTLIEQTGDVLSFGSRDSAPSGGNAASTRAARLVFTILRSEHLNPVSKAYYHQTRAARLGEQWTTVVNACAASPEERAECVKRGIKAIEGVVLRLSALYDRRGGSEEGKPGGPFVLGEEPCFLDFEIAGRYKFLLEGLTPSEAEGLSILDGGRLTQLAEDLETYCKV